MKNYITVNNLKIEYQKLEHTDKSIIFLHNSSGSMAVWEEQWADERFGDYTLMRFDLPGHGSSSRSLHPEKDYSLSGLAHVILQVIEQLQTERYIICAVSLATNLAGEIAHLLPGCKGFFMAGASVIGNNLTPADILLPFQYGDALFAEDPPDETLKNYIKGLTFHHKENIQAKLISDYRNTDSRFRAVIGQSIASGEWTDEIQNLVNSGRTAAWVFGKDEQIINADYLGKMPVNQWRDKIHFINDAGHLVNLDQPATFNQLLLEFADEMLG
ncbi:alpha/beta hydrolase (plasmid) [Pedobacter sp. BS3]|uniref:alpha/beta fold hydrolase n=1 Tax=Pedobacter sp. BS3 TaxID=2567937 RepID=UPI0011EE6A6E|nr:alpha/beta hydrolase [Pedobacter sp. BS3]TZF85791.1 alpha/beta hydrolase [Pedobacter sp. BS3]